MSWWLDLYDGTLADVLLVREHADETSRTVGFLVEALALTPGARVFDQCCGIGSLAIPLAQRGYEVVGCDMGTGYVERALEEAEAHGVSLELYRADARSFVPAVPCQAAFNWWTSFGYAEEDETNLKMLRCARDALWPGGRFALDFMNLDFAPTLCSGAATSAKPRLSSSLLVAAYLQYASLRGCGRARVFARIRRSRDEVGAKSRMNVPGVLRSFLPRVETRRIVRGEEIVLVRESRVDLARMVLEKDWSFCWPDGRERRVLTRVRLYTPRELDDLLRQAGFVDVTFVGDVAGGPLLLDSPRCIALARRRPV